MQWGSGTEDLSIFNPAKLETRQWVKTFKSAGIKTIILVCKHHDGFCLWPSTYRERTVKNTPWKNGNGDVVREFFDACREAGVRTCIYYSPWDKQEPYGKPEYNDLMVNELTELLTNYGNVDLVWFDGAGINPKTSGKKMDFDWQRIYSTIRSLQPQALISGAAPDVRWVGNEGGKGRFTEWSVQGIKLKEADFSGFNSGVPLTAKNLGYREQLLEAEQLAWYPARGGLPIRHQWFWKPGQQNRSLEYLVKSYFETVGQNSNLLVNLSPNSDGLVPEDDVERMAEFGKYLEVLYQRNYAEGAVAKSASIRSGGFAANHLFDDDLRTCWMAPEGETSGEIIVELYGEQSFNVIKLQENIAGYGQRIEKFEIDAWDGKTWETMGKGTTIGIRRLLRVPDTKTEQLRIRIIESRDAPSLATLELYRAPKQVSAPKLSRNEKGLVTIDVNGMAVKFTTDGSDPKHGQVYTTPFSFLLGGIIRVIAESDDKTLWMPPEKTEVFGICSNYLTCSADVETKNMFDENPRTIVEFNLNKKSNRFFTIKLPEQNQITGFSYTPPGGKPERPGRIEKYNVYFKSSNGKWALASSGEFGNIDNNPIERKVIFENVLSTNEIKFEIISATKDQKIAVVAEFKLFAE